MNAMKPWYLSRTIWASLVTVATAVGGLLGFPVEERDGEAVSEMILQAVTAISGLMAIVGRVTADSRIG
ncbi:hypothetical protein [Chelativorans sp. M5D2P16]|uniref:hypothetical protein n=1 Tax=Chelativorans sp. M5D2P16 TaxID=3095678 RepID=UPI002ACA6875|nr:hypothetical protein [Chelativorans sp. M5D2P16]MDZ5698358.1 hypothetical protein [Chelativorans sp. M5D2P16]